MITVPQKTLFLVLSCLGPLSLQTRAKLRKSLKYLFNCCKLQIVFKSQNNQLTLFVLKIAFQKILHLVSFIKSQNKSTNTFRFTDCIPKEFTSGVVYKFQCGRCNESYYGECIKHLSVRIGGHIRTSRLTKKKVKPKDNTVQDHLLLCNNSPFFENFSVSTKENRKFVVELKESFLIMRDKPSLNRNIRSAPSYLFDKV